MTKQRKIPSLPSLLKRKIYKTGQTRGADDDVIYQNRVARNSTVLIPYQLWDNVSLPPAGSDKFERGFICLISPEEYFNTATIKQDLNDRGLSLGKNALIFYTTRSQWELYPPELYGWQAASNRINPLGGQYVARIASTTGYEVSRINQGFTTTKMKGAGIRLYEYANKNIIDACTIQLEAIFWLCYDSIPVVQEYGMNVNDAVRRREACLKICEEEQLLDFTRLVRARIIDGEGAAICPLCLEKISSLGFFLKVAQATGREVHDLTVTQLNLFHVKELRYGEYNHRPYNLGWGHHHCNVVVKDSGIYETIEWMHKVVEKNKLSGYFSLPSNDN